MNKDNGSIKHPLVLFSGGLDSTALLFKALIENPVVTVLCCSLGKQDAKNIAEKQARENILSVIYKLQQKHPDKYGRIDYIGEYEVAGTVCNSKVKLPQKIGFLGQALLSMTDEVTEVQLGIVSSDSDACQVDRYRTLWSVMQSASLVKDPISLEFPLLFSDKQSILWFMSGGESGGREALKYISWCDTPIKGKSCAGCDSCLAMAKTYGYIKEYNPSLFAKFKNQRQINQFLLKHKISNCQKLTESTQ